MSIRLAIVPFVVALSLSAVAAQQAPQPITGIISGWVADAASGQNIEGATVTLRSVDRIDAVANADGKVTAVPHPAVVTDAQGQFAFNAVRVGAYTVTVTTRGGFVQGSAFLELGENQQITDLTVRLNRFGSIAGTVSNEAAQGIAGMRVEAFQKRTSGLKATLSSRGAGLSDERGQFRIGDLPPGEYLICACSRDRAAFPITFHPGSTLASGAVAIEVGSGEDKADVDISVGAATPRRVSGQLNGLGSNSAAGLTLLLIVKNDISEAEEITSIDSVTVTPAGAFDFVAVPPGTYSLEVYPTDGKGGLWASMQVDVGEQDVAGLNVPLGAGATVSGRIEFAGGTPRPAPAELAKARVTLAPLDFTPRVMTSAGTSGSVGHWSTPGPDGRFRIEGVPPGRYVASATRLGPSWQLLESIRTGESSAADPMVTVDETGLGDLVITMSDATPAMLLGTVELDRFESPLTVNVLLFPSEPDAWTETYRSPTKYAITSVSNGKTFRFTGLAEGEYLAALVPADTAMGPEQFQLWSQNATRVTLKAGETTTIEVRR